MSFEANRYLPALRAALLMLSLPPDDQIRIKGPGCLACDLLGDFDIAVKDVLENVALDPESRELLIKMQDSIKKMPDPDHECFNPKVLRRESWQLLRISSHNALSLFGWHDARLEPFTEVEPGVWLRRRMD